MMINVELASELQGVAVGLVQAEAVTLGDAGPELRGWLNDHAEAVKRDGAEGGDARRAAVRGMLRRGGFKPAGRNKPAQEYLLRTLSEQGCLPSINNAVDVLNAVSLRCGYPISLVGLERLGRRAEIRYGKAGESFVFNSAGQELNLTGLLCLCRCEDDTASLPLGTPVKDSLEAKIKPQDRSVLACIYAPTGNQVDGDDANHSLPRWVGYLAEAFGRWCGTCAVETGVLRRA